MQSAITEFYNPDTEESQDSAVQPTPASGPAPATSEPPPSTNPPTKKKFATLGDLRVGGNGGGHDHSQDGHDSDDSDKNQNLFAGGEKSGLAVENPDDLKKKIIERAKK